MPAAGGNVAFSWLEINGREGDSDLQPTTCIRAGILSARSRFVCDSAITFTVLLEPIADGGI